MGGIILEQSFRFLALILNNRDSTVAGNRLPPIIKAQTQSIHKDNADRPSMSNNGYSLAWMVINDLLYRGPEYKKKHVATMANLEAAIICNHKRKPPKKWKESLAKKKERLKKLRLKSTPGAKKRKRILESKIKAYRETRDYNLGTSLKSYIDPRIYYRWGRKVDFDWKLYYPKALQKKFSWVERAS